MQAGIPGSETTQSTVAIGVTDMQIAESGSNKKSTTKKIAEVNAAYANNKLNHGEWLVVQHKKKKPHQKFNNGKIDSRRPIGSKQIQSPC